MLAAIGATQKHLRLVLIANGAIVGAIAALCGTLVGLALWVVVRPDARVRCRPSRRPAQPSVAADRADRPPRSLRGDRRRLVAGANGRPAPRHARALGAAAQAEARTPLGDRGRRADRGRHRLPRTVEPRQAAAHRRRDRGDDPRLPAPRPAGDPRLLRPRRASLHRTPVGASRPRSLSGPFRSGARRGHPRPRHRGDGRRHRLGRGGEEGGRAGQPVRPADPGLPRPTGRPGAHPGRRTRSARAPGRARPTARRPTRRGNRDSAPQGRPTRRRSLRPRRHPSASRRSSSRRRSNSREAGSGTSPNRRSMSPRRRCSATSESIPPRSIRARTSSPTAASGPTSSSSRT